MCKISDQSKLKTFSKWNLVNVNSTLCAVVAAADKMDQLQSIRPLKWSEIHWLNWFKCQANVDEMLGCWMPQAQQSKTKQKRPKRMHSFAVWFNVCLILHWIRAKVCLHLQLSAWAERVRHTQKVIRQKVEWVEHTNGGRYSFCRQLN